MTGFEFANPSFLWGALAALIPLVIHLFNRKRARPHPFAAIDFVLRSRKRTARRLRLKRLLLFLTRTLLLLAVPLAMAKPRFKQDATASAPEGPAATAIVIDPSLSMSYRQDGQSLLERAKELGKQTLARLRSEDPVTVVTCNEPAEAPHFARGKAREAIELAEQLWTPHDLMSCLQKAAAVLGESPVAGKRIVVISDLTAPSLRLDVPPPLVSSPQGDVVPEVVFLDAAEGAEELPNVGVIGVKIDPSPGHGHRAYQFEITVANHSSKPLKDFNVAVRVGTDVVAKGFLDVAARGIASKLLTYRFPSGGQYVGTVEIAPDAYAADDRRHFALKVPQDIRALVVNGSPHPLRYMDESFFVETALTSPGSPVRPTLRDTDLALNERFAAYDLILLLNVRELPPSKASELASFVKAGGGLFISVGDQVDPDVYNASLGAVLPRPLRLVKTATDPNAADADEKAARLMEVALDHPALGVFGGEALEGFLSARTYRYMLLEPGAPGQVKHLATFDDGSPALVEGRLGKGRVLLYTSTVDRDWSDWPIRTSFLPALQRLSGWLVGMLDERAIEQILVGQTKVLDIEGASGFKATGPDGKPLTVELSTEGQSKVSGTRLPGIYTVSMMPGKQPGASSELKFAVNVDPAESHLARIDSASLKAHFGEKPRTDSTPGDTGSSEPPLWTWRLVAAALFFFFEGLLLSMR